MSSRTLVAIATYNEIETLPSLIDALCEALPEADFLVVDDNSPDGTGKWAEKRSASDDRVRVIHRSGKLGLGSATIAAMKEAIEQDYDIIATLDADWSHPPDLMPAVIGLVSAGADVAIGSRYISGGRIVDWPLSRKVASRLVNSAARLLLRLTVRDCSGAMRAYRVSTLAQLDLAEMQCEGYAYLEEILWRLKRTGASMAEAPITFTERRAGASKINRNEAVAAAKLLLRLGRAEWLGKQA